MNVEKNLGTNFAKKKLGEVYFSICACKIILFLDLRIIPDRPESTGEAFIPSRKMLREII